MTMEPENSNLAAHLHGATHAALMSSWCARAAQTARPLNREPCRCRNSQARPVRASSDEATGRAPSSRRTRRPISRPGSPSWHSTPPPEPLHAGARLRNYFLTGLVVVGPVTITLYIAWYFINIVDAWVKPYIPRIYNPESYLPFPVPGVGLVFAIIGLTLIGALAANLLGRSLISAGELMLGRMPIVRNVYQGLKQIFESVVTASTPSQSFQKVALMEFPSKGIWSLVFVTGDAAEQISARDPRRGPDQRVHADGHAAAVGLRVLRAAHDRGARAR